MLKLMKYELRRMRTSLLVILGILLALLIFTLALPVIEDEPVHVFWVNLFIYGMFGTIAYAFIQGPARLSKELRQKSGYMLFMTPNSALKILSARVLIGMLTAGVLVVLFVAAAMFGLSHLLKTSGLQYGLYALVSDIVQSPGISDMTGGQAVYLSALTVFGAAASFLYSSAVLYFAITLSASILEGKKGLGWLTLLIVIVMTSILSRLHEWSMGLEQGYVPIPILLEAALGLAGIWGSAMLLEKKVSL